MTRKRQSSWLALLSGLVSVAVACGDKGSSTFSPPFPPMSLLDQLSPQQRDQLCAEVNAFIKSSGTDQVLKEGLCRSFGVSAAATSRSTTDADARAACSVAYDSCEMGAFSQSPSCPGAAWAATTCMATIGEYAACINDESTALPASVRAVPTCDVLTLSDLAMPTTASQPPSSCQALEQQCPGASGISSAKTCSTPTQAALAPWTGIYQVASYTDNTAACDVEGASVLSQQADSYFAAVDVVTLGAPYLQIVSCADTATCEAKVAGIRAGTGYSYNFGFQLSCTEANGSLDGGIQFSGSPTDHGTCDMPMLQEAVLARVSPTELRIDSRTYVGDSYQQDAQGICWNTASDTSTKSPCTRYNVLTADFVESLPH